ncbi:MAG: hypothetical protein V4621_00565 [Pseudomonadota bacterium]
MAQNWKDINARLAVFREMDTPTAVQISEVQQSLANAGLWSHNAITGENSPLLNMTLAMTEDEDLAVKVVAKTRDFTEGNTPPEYIMAAEAALTRLGYNTPISGNPNADTYLKSLEAYRQDHPLPLSPQQLSMVAEDIGGRIALEVKNNHVHAKMADVPALTNQALDTLRQQNLIPQTLSAADREATVSALQDQFLATQLAIPNLKPEMTQVAPQVSVMRVSPDQISKGSFYGQRIAERAVWEMGNKAIAAAGGQVISIDGADEAGGKREVFARDRFVMVGDTAYLPDIAKYGEIYGAEPGSKAYHAYEGEIDQARAYLMRQGIETVDVKGAWFEGGNIVQHAQSRTIFMGIEPGRDTESATALVDAINTTQSLQDGRYSMVAVPMEGYDPQGVYHLDLALSEQLPGGKVLFDATITDAYTADKIATTFGPQNMIAMTTDEAVAGAANILVVKDTAVLTREIPRIQTVLEQAGVNTISARDFEAPATPLLNDILERDQFMYGNGGMRCMGQVIAQMDPVQQQVMMTHNVALAF